MTFISGPKYNLKKFIKQLSDITIDFFCSNEKNHLKLFLKWKLLLVYNLE